MTDAVRFKVCGLTSVADAVFAARCGAAYLGFILHPKSPRYLPLARFREMARQLPDRPRVAVSVEPALEDLAAMHGAEFDFFQIHFGPGTTEAQVAAWSQAVGETRLWLAPKIPPGGTVPAFVLAAARYILFDTFQPDGFGGSGRTGDWPAFVRHQNANTKNVWILAGGLTPENIAEALRQTQAKIVDVNSGVESAPGVKDHGKLRRFAQALGK